MVIYIATLERKKAYAKQQIEEAKKWHLGDKLGSAIFCCAISVSISAVIDILKSKNEHDTNVNIGAAALGSIVAIATLNYLKRVIFCETNTKSPELYKIDIWHYDKILNALKKNQTTA